MANPAPTINQINAFNATQGTTIDFNIIGGTELVRSNRIYIYDLSDNSLICTHLYVSTESIHELPPNTDASMVYESGKSSADFVNGAQYYAQIQTFTDIGGTEGGSGLSVAKMFWCLDDPTLTITTIPSTISTTSYNVSATYNANTSVVSNIIQQYQFSLYSATGSLLQSSGVVVGSGTQQGTSTAYDISYNFSGLSVGSSYYVVVDVTTTQGMSINAQSSTFTVSIDTPTLGEATVVNNACDGYISVTSNLSSEYGGSASGEIATFETDSVNNVTKLEVTLEPTQEGTGDPSPTNVRPITGHDSVEVTIEGKNLYNPAIQTILQQGTVLNGDTFTMPWTDGSLRITGKYTQIFPAGSYTIRVFGSPLSDIICGVYRASDDATYTSQSMANRLSITVPYPFYIAFYGRYNAPNTGIFKVQVEEGSIATDYEPYQPPITASQDFNVSLTPTSTDTDPYLFKAVGDIYGDRLEEDIVGGTVCWNQLVRNGNFASATGWYKAASTTLEVANNVAKVTQTAQYQGITTVLSSNPLASGHKYLIVADVKADSERGLDFVLGDNTYFTLTGAISVTTAWATYGKIVNVTSANIAKNNQITGIRDSHSSGFVPYYVKNFDCIDLTAFFGNTTIADAIYAMEQAEAGSGVAFMRKYFSDVFTADYDRGTLKSVTPIAHKMVGVNAWDEEWEVGTINTNTGVNIAYSGCIRSKNYIKVLPNTTYYIQYPNISGSALLYYDEDENFISAYGIATAREFTPPSNCGYVRFKLGDAYGTTYNNDICINISNPTINGKYFPYEEHTYDLGNVPLYGLFQLENNKLKAYGDVRHAIGGTDRKFMLVDLGTLNYTLNATGRFYAMLPVLAKPTGSYNTKANLLCEKYDNITQNQLFDGIKGIATQAINGNTVYIYDSAYTDAATLKTALSGTYLLYEKATTTTEQTDPFEQYQEVSKYGTLEYITTNNVPVGHNTTYLTRDVFGGYIDLVSGQLVVDRAYKKFMSNEPTSHVYGVTVGEDRSRVVFNTGALPNAKAGYYLGFTSNAFNYEFNSQPAVGNGAINNGNLLVGVPNTVTTKEEVVAYMAEIGAEFVYKLATPLTYQLTPQQIQTLIGQNNVWSEQGDIELSYHIPITNLLVKRQDVDDVSGNWLTLYSQPVEQASDMDFTFIDFLNQYGKTYKYALVPLLTQTQSGVEVEVEGGYTVSDEVQSIFDGVFISDSTGSQKCKANVGYGNVNMNQSVGSITPIGSQYPIIVTNSNNRYHNGSISGMIVPDDYYYNGNLSRIDMVNKRNELEQFLTNKRAKIIKDWNSNIWLVMIMDNIDCSFDNNYGMGIVTFNANWLEIGNPTSQQDLQDTGLINVGGV